jgi:acetyl esterase/lipase
VAYDAASRPSFAAPIYGAPRVTAPLPADAPPLFVAVANDDARAAENCVALYQAWKAAGRSAELHVYGRGGHGFGLRQMGTTSDGWIEQFGAWLQMEGFAP